MLRPGLFKITEREFLVVQWLGRHAVIAKGPDSILGQRTKIPQALAKIK